eukprot:Opistho-2@78375
MATDGGADSSLFLFFFAAGFFLCNGASVTLYVSGSLHGNVLPNQDPLWGEYGGLARMATLMRSRFDRALQDTGTNSTAIIAIDTGGFVGVSRPFTQYANRSALLGIAESMGFSAFSLTATDVFAGAAAFLDDYETLINASVICSNAVMRPTASDRMRGVLKPFSIQVVNNVTCGILSFVDLKLCETAPSFCGPGKDVLGVDDPDKEGTIATAVNRMLASVDTRPDVIVAVAPYSLLTLLTIGHTFGDYAANSGIDIVLAADGNYLSATEINPSATGEYMSTTATSTLLTPPPIVNIAVGGSNRRLLVASSMANGRTVAKIDLTVDTAATERRLSVRPTTEHIFLRPCGTGIANFTYPLASCVDSAAEDIAATLQDIRGAVDQMLDSVVGVLKTALFMEGSFHCRYAECSGGDILTDAMRSYIPSCDIAFANGGFIRAGFPNAIVTGRTVFNAYPFGRTFMSTLSLRGDVLINAIRYGLSLVTNIYSVPITPLTGSGRYLQFSGLRIRYNPFNPIETRLLSIETEVSPGVYSPFETFGVYRCCTLTYLADGGDGYAMIRDNALQRIDHVVTQDAVVRMYFAANPDGLNVTLGQRIIINDVARCVPPCVHGSCAVNLTCVCEGGWSGIDCNVTLVIPIDICDLHRVSGRILLRTHGAIDDISAAVGVITLFSVLFAAEVLCVPYFTHRFARVVRTSRSRSNDIVRTARLNRANVIRLMLLALQGVQIHAIVLNVELSDMFVESNGKVFSSISISAFASSFFWYFWVVMAVTLLWLVYAWAYMLDGGVFLRKTAVGRVFLFPADQFLQLWVSAGFIPTLLNGMRAFHCWYLDDATAFMATDGVCSVPCWTGEHWAYIAVSFVTLLVYYPLATISALLWQDLDAHQEVRNAPHAFIVEPLIKVALVVMRVYFTSFPVAYLSIVAVICAATAVYHWRWAPCYVAWVNTPMALAYMSAFGTAFVLLIGVVTDRNDAFFAVPAIWVAAAAGGLVYLRWMYPDDLVKRKPHEADLNAREMLMAIKKVFVRRGSAAVSTPSFPQTSGAQLRARLSVAWNNPVTS